jgi:hypothetical protein
VPDAIDAAVAQAEAPRPEQRTNVAIRLHTGRGVALNVPVDLTSEELLGLAGYVATGLPAKLAEAQSAPRLVVARGSVPRA